MKKQNWMIWIGVLMVILVGIAISLWLLNKNKSPMLEENKGELYLNRSYDFNMIFLSENMDNDIEGSYTIENNTLTYEIEETKRSIYKNLYKEFYNILSISSIENKEYSIQIPASQIKKILLFAQIPTLTGNYDCKYEVENQAIYSIECRQLNNQLLIDFDFE